MHLAHGIGGVEGLPLPGELVLQTGGVVVLASFLTVALLWKQPRFTPSARASRGSPALQALLLVVAAGVVGYGFLGPQDPDANPAPRALYVLLWVGIVPVSLLFGPVWRTVNPLRLLVRGRAGRPLPPRLGY